MSGVERNVTVEGVRLRFAAAHMATIGGELEPLHGHNYQVRCRVDGELTEDRWVIDFGVLKRITRATCEELDHKFLLQHTSKLIAIDEEGDDWVLRFASRTYRFPRSDVAVLEIENTTAELLAEWIAGRVVDALRSTGNAQLSRVSVDVEEMPGQSGGFSLEL